MLRNLNSFSRHFSTKGSKRTRRIAKIRRIIEKSTPRSLPTYLHSDLSNEWKQLLQDRDQVYRIKETAQYLLKVFSEAPSSVPIDTQVRELRDRAKEIQKKEYFTKNYQFALEKLVQDDSFTPEKFEKWRNEVIPIQLEDFQVKDKIEPKPVKKLEKIEYIPKDQESSSIEKVENKPTEVIEYVPIQPSPEELREYMQSQVAVLKSLPEEELKRRRREAYLKILKMSYKEFLDSMKVTPPVEVHQISGTLAEFTEKTVEKYLDKSWYNTQVLNTLNESSDDVEKELNALLEQNREPFSRLGIRLIRAYERENNLEGAWKSYVKFHSEFAIENPELNLCGIDILNKRKDPERAIVELEMAETEHGKDYLPLYYHSVMAACAKVRGTCYYTFQLYDKMTKIDMLVPNRQTLSTVLDACSTLGDVERAKLLWKEIVGVYKIEPDEYNCVEMLNTIARGNRMLRARKLKAKSVKLLTFEDKALLAQAAGFRPPPIEKKDEVREVLSQLEGVTPFDQQNEGDYTIEDINRLLGDEEDLEGEDDEHSSESVGENEEESEEDLNEYVDVVEDAHVAVLPGISPVRIPAPKYFPQSQAQENLIKLEHQFMKSQIDKVDLLSEIPKIDTSTRLSLPNHMNETNSSIEPIKDQVEKVIKNPTAPGVRQQANIEFATAFLEEIQDKYQLQVSPEMLNAYLKVFAEGLRVKRAIDNIQLFEKYGLEPDIYTHNTIIKMLSRAQRVDRTVEYFKSLDLPREKINRQTIGPIIDVLARHGRIEQALDFYYEYKDMNILEKYIRVLRIQLQRNNDPRVRDIPQDPNLWRSKEKLAKGVLAINKSPRLRLLDQWMKGQSSRRR